MKAEDALASFEIVANKFEVYSQEGEVWREGKRKKKEGRYEGPLFQDFTEEGRGIFESFQGLA